MTTLRRFTMKVVFMLCVLFVVHAATLTVAHAADLSAACTRALSLAPYHGEPIPGHMSNRTGGFIVLGPVVPNNEAWLVTAAGLINVWSYPIVGSSFMIGISDPYPEQGLFNPADELSCCWHIPLAVANGDASSFYGTYYVAIPRRVVLRATQRLVGQSNHEGQLYDLNSTWLRYPAACAASLAIQ